jgi:5'-nucleotidase
MVNILVSNDDGIFAPGLFTLAQAMQAIGNVTVVAPQDNQSASGHRKTMTRPLRATPINGVFDEGIPAFAVDGAPSDCTALALMGIVQDKFDIVVAGINNGPNLGQDLTYSGTVSVALEAAIFGLPGIAFSLDDRKPDADYSMCVPFAQQITRKVLEHGLPHQTILNVNFPALPHDEIKGVRVTVQGRRVYRDILDTRIDPFGKPYYWIAGEEPTGEVSIEGTDIWAIHQKFVSVTPVHLDLTRHHFMDTLRGWKLNND